MNAYAPITVEVRDKYMEWWHGGEYVGQDAEAGEGFDAWLQSVKADAWDEGYGLGIEVGHRGDDYWEKNPYRSNA